MLKFELFPQWVTDQKQILTILYSIMSIARININKHKTYKTKLETKRKKSDKQMVNLFNNEAFCCNKNWRAIFHCAKLSSSRHQRRCCQMNRVERIAIFCIRADEAPSTHKAISLYNNLNRARACCAITSPIMSWIDHGNSMNQAIWLVHISGLLPWPQQTQQSAGPLLVVFVRESELLKKPHCSPECHNGDAHWLVISYPLSWVSTIAWHLSLLEKHSWKKKRSIWKLA